MYLTIHYKIQFTIQKNRKTIHDSNLDSITMSDATINKFGGVMVCWGFSRSDEELNGCN